MMENSGGHETTSAVLFWFVKYMPLDAEIQHRLYEEVANVFGNDLSSITLDVLEDYGKVPVLEAVVTETLRCAMVGGAIGRYCELTMVWDFHFNRRLPWPAYSNR